LPNLSGRFSIKFIGEKRIIFKNTVDFYEKEPKKSGNPPKCGLSANPP
jgi:hypothetical protein